MTSNAQMNGTEKFIDTFDIDDPEYVRQMMRPVEVKEDVRQMEERRRVKLILQSRSFRDELEELVDEQVQIPGLASPGGSITIQQLSDLLAPRVKSIAIGNGVGPCIPISDLKTELGSIPAKERILRCKLASIYRLVDLFGWSTGLNSYITARISQDYERYLVRPYGLSNHEVTAGSLSKVDSRGEALDAGSSNLIVDRVSFLLHSAIYASRPDARCIVHLNGPAALAASALAKGLLPLDANTTVLGEIGFYVYSGAAPDLEQKEKIRRALGPTGKILVIRCFGIIILGESVEEAFTLSQIVQSTTELQLQLATIPAGLSKIRPPSDEEKSKAYDIANRIEVDENGVKWKFGEREFEAIMKHLDNAGYRTGYPYRDAISNSDGVIKKRMVDSGITQPPTNSGFVYEFVDDFKTSSSSKTNKDDMIMNSNTSHNMDKSNSGQQPYWVPDDTSTPLKPAQQQQTQQQQPNNNLQNNQVTDRQQQLLQKELHQEKNTTVLKESYILAGSNGQKKVSGVTNGHPEELKVGGKQNQQLDSPQKSLSSVEGTLDDRVGSPTKDASATLSPSKEKKKKKGGFFSSFNKKKDKQ